MPVHPLVSAALLLLASTSAAATSLHIPRPDAPPPSGQDASLTGLAFQPVLRTGVPVPLEIAVRPADWETAGDQHAVWTLHLESEDASYIGLRLDAPRLPEGAELRLLGEEGQLRGPYTRADRNTRGQLWLPMVRGDSARLEIRVPASATPAVQLGGAELHYGMRDPLRTRTKAQGDAGGCHNDVACPQGDGWDSAIRSTALLIIGNQLICNGVLLNNTRGDGDPLMITADHCGIRSDDSGEGFPADSVTAIFNFQAAECGSNARVGREDRIEGSTLLYRHRESDTSLIRLDRAPPERFRVSFGGWDASGSGAGSGSGVHHPSGDLKKISLFEQPLAAERVTITGGGIRTDSQEVESWRVEWNDGVTEPGSSGSGIWTSQQRLLGVLSGGSSQCASDGVLLGIGGQEEDKGPDFYGRLAFAFDNPGALGTPLRAFLDPAGNGSRRINARGVDSRPTTPPTSDGTTDGGAGSGGGGGALGLPSALLLMAVVLRRRILMLYRLSIRAS